MEVMVGYATTVGAEDMSQAVGIGIEFRRKRDEAVVCLEIQGSSKSTKL